VGAFVLGAIALGLAAVVALSSGDWFAPKERFAVFIPGSVRGLNRGAPVTFRGVKIGEVKEVTAFLTGKDDTPIQIEVVVEFRGDVIEAPEGVDRPFAAARGAELARRLIAFGLRGRMLSQSLLTGQKYIDFDFLPEEPARVAGLGRRYPELPTAATSMEKLGRKGEQFFDKLGDLPLDQMLEDVRQALRSLRALLESEDLKGAVAGARRVTSALEPTVQDTRQAVGKARELIDTLSGEVKETSAGARDALRDLRKTLDRAEQAMARLEQAAEGTDEARVAAMQTLDEMSRALKALRNLVDYIQTHPEAVVLGKERAKEKE
jgi:paraquat-inducible protein B